MLAKGYVGTNYITSARRNAETRRDGTRQEKLRDEPTQHYIAVHGSRVIYDLYITHMHLSRERMRTGFFYDLGFLLTDWNRIEESLDQSNVRIFSGMITHRM